MYLIERTKKGNKADLHIKVGEYVNVVNRFLPRAKCIHQSKYDRLRAKAQQGGHVFVTENRFKEYHLTVNTL